MPHFRAEVVRAAPLWIQLTAGEKGVRIVGWEASTETTFGAVSRPVLTRPSKPGVFRDTNRNVHYALDNPSLAATATVLTEFSEPPSLPEVSPISSGLPIGFEMRMTPAQAVVVDPGESVLLYAAVWVESDNDRIYQGWSASLEWEEL